MNNYAKMYTIMNQSVVLGSVRFKKSFLNILCSPRLQYRNIIPA